MTDETENPLKPIKIRTGLGMAPEIEIGGVALPTTNMVDCKIEPANRRNLLTVTITYVADEGIIVTGPQE